MWIHTPKTSLGTYIIHFSLSFHDWGKDYIDDDVNIGLLCFCWFCFYSSFSFLQFAPTDSFLLTWILICWSDHWLASRLVPALQRHALMQAEAMNTQPQLHVDNCCVLFSIWKSIHTELWISMPNGTQLRKQKTKSFILVYNQKPCFHKPHCFNNHII